MDAAQSSTYSAAAIRKMTVPELIALTEDRYILGFVIAYIRATYPEVMAEALNAELESRPDAVAAALARAENYAAVDARRADRG
jgi:hypothetical protein